MAITSPNYAAKQFSRCLLCVVLCSNYAEVNVTMTRSISGTGRSVCKLHFLFQCFSFLFHLNTFSFRLSHLTINLAIATMQRWAKKKLLHSKLIIVNLRMYTRSLIASSRCKKRAAHHQLSVEVQCEKKKKLIALPGEEELCKVKNSIEQIFLASPPRATKERRKTFFHVRDLSHESELT